MEWSPKSTEMPEEKKAAGVEGGSELVQSSEVDSILRGSSQLLDVYGKLWQPQPERLKKQESYELKVSVRLKVIHNAALLICMVFGCNQNVRGRQVLTFKMRLSAAIATSQTSRS